MEAVEHINRLLDAAHSPERESLHEEYMRLLWRGDGQPHEFYDVLTGERFSACVYAVEPMGHLVLRTCPDGTLRRYAFKEVAWL